VFLRKRVREEEKEEEGRKLVRKMEIENSCNKNNNNFVKYLN
jgi:hypothetical protein